MDGSKKDQPSDHRPHRSSAIGAAEKIRCIIKASEGILAKSRKSKGDKKSTKSIDLHGDSYSKPELKLPLNKKDNVCRGSDNTQAFKQNNISSVKPSKDATNIRRVCKVKKSCFRANYVNRTASFLKASSSTTCAKPCSSSNVTSSVDEANAVVVDVPSPFLIPRFNYSRYKSATEFNNDSDKCPLVMTCVEEIS